MVERVWFIICEYLPRHDSETTEGLPLMGLFKTKDIAQAYMSDCIDDTVKWTRVSSDFYDGHSEGTGSRYILSIEEVIND